MVLRFLNDFRPHNSMALIECKKLELSTMSGCRDLKQPAEQSVLLSYLFETSFKNALKRRNDDDFFPTYFLNFSGNDEEISIVL
jgi:hypothetical protein